jgi:hypothetical protein
MMDDIPGPLVVAHDVVEDGLHLAVVGPWVGQKAPCGLGVAQDRRQRLVQLVGEGGHQLAGNIDTRQTLELVAGTFQLALAGEPVGDVLADAEQAGIGPVRRG